MRSLSDSPAMMVGAHRQTSTASAQRGAIPDSPATRGGTQNRSRLNRGGCRPPPHRAEPRPDSPAAVGGARQQRSPDVSVAAWTRPRRREARTGKQPSGRGEEPVTATPHGAIAGLAREMGGAHRHHQHANTQADAEVDAVGGGGWNRPVALEGERRGRRVSGAAFAMADHGQTAPMAEGP